MCENGLKMCENGLECPFVSFCFHHFLSRSINRRNAFHEFQFTAFFHPSTHTTRTIGKCDRKHQTLLPYNHPGFIQMEKVPLTQHHLETFLTSDVFDAELIESMYKIAVYFRETSTQKDKDGKSFTLNDLQQVPFNEITTWFETYKKKKENEKEKIQNEAFEREIKKYVQGAVFQLRHYSYIIGCHPEDLIETFETKISDDLEEILKESLRGEEEDTLLSFRFTCLLQNDEEFSTSVQITLHGTKPEFIPLVEFLVSALKKQHCTPEIKEKMEQSLNSWSKVHRT